MLSTIFKARLGHAVFAFSKRVLELNTIKAAAELSDSTQSVSLQTARRLNFNLLVDVSALGCV